MLGFDRIGLRTRRLLWDRAARIDVVVAGLLSAGGLATLGVQHLHASLIVAGAFGVACTSAVAWRRDAPASAALVVLVGAVAYEYVTRDQHLVFEPFAIVLVLYTAAARGSSRRDVVQTAVLALLAVTAIVAVVQHGGGLSVGTVLIPAFPIVVLPSLAGLVVARQRSLTAKLAATNEGLRGQRELRTAQAAAEERTRVAREIHDVVAHHMSVMVIQSGAARLMLCDDVSGARAAMRTVATCAREASVELAKLGDLNVSSGGAEDPRGSLLDKLNSLLERDGFRATLEVDGTPEDLPAELDLAAYRVVQEALTNAFKYAPTQPVSVRVGFAQHGLTLRISNGGNPGPTDRGPSLSGGHGLIGMRERVEAHGGWLRAGPRPDGGYEVLAELPSAAPTPAGDHQRWPDQAWRTAAFTTFALVVLELNAVLSRTRTGPLAVNVVLIAAMCAALTFRRRSPLTFLVAVLALAVPLSGGLASMADATLVSTYVFFVPVWTVATHATGWRSYVGLALAVGTLPLQGFYWHVSAGSVLVSAGLTVVVWIGGRIVRANRALVAAVHAAHSLLVAEQAESERIAAIVERSHILTELNRQITEEVAGMTRQAETACRLIESDPDSAADMISALEARGHDALARTRHILGLLRAANEPLELKPPADLAVTR